MQACGTISDRFGNASLGHHCWQRNGEKQRDLMSTDGGIEGRSVNYTAKLAQVACMAGRVPLDGSASNTV